MKFFVLAFEILQLFKDLSKYVIYQEQIFLSTDSYLSYVIDIHALFLINSIKKISNEDSTLIFLFHGIIIEIGNHLT